MESEEEAFTPDKFTPDNNSEDIGPALDRLVEALNSLHPDVRQQLLDGMDDGSLISLAALLYMPGHKDPAYHGEGPQVARGLLEDAVATYRRKTEQSLRVSTTAGLGEAEINT